MGQSYSMAKEAEKELPACNLAANLDAILQAIRYLEGLKIDVEHEIAGEKMLMTSSFDHMREIHLKRDQEIEMIKSETEAQLLKYRSVKYDN